MFAKFSVLTVTMVLLSAICATGMPGQTQLPQALPLEEQQARAGEDPSVPRGIEVQARGPVHEAFATPTAESAATPLLPKRPPAPIEEMPPAEKPEGDVAWIAGYWHWDDDRQDYLWVSGCWRTIPPGRQWIGGYWREQGEQWQWVSGFWAAAPNPGGAPALGAKAGAGAELTYYPEPPAPPQVAPPGPAPNPDSFFVPGYYVWREGRYAWSAGYWARVQPGYVWVAGHYRWTPYGYVYVAGYWDFALARRGILYAPVVVDFRVVGPRFVYTPVYAVSDVVIVDALWVRPACCHYYFGDYYGPAYRRFGFESCIVYSQRHYDSIIVYRSWECRNEPRWHEAQINIYLARDGGRAPLPPRTLAQQNILIRQQTTNINVTQVNNIHVLAPASKVAAAQGIKTTTITTETRVKVKANALEVQKVTVQQRVVTESARVGPASAPRTASLAVPATTPTAHTSSPAASAAGGAHPLGGPAAKSLAVPAHPSGPPGPTGPQVTKTGQPTHKDGKTGPTNQKQLPGKQPPHKEEHKGGEPQRGGGG